MPRAASAVVDKDRGWHALCLEIDKLKADPYVKVGLLGDGAVRPDEEGLTNPELGAIHEFGAPSVHIPARPFIGTTFDEKTAEWGDKIKRLVDGIYKGKNTVERSLEIMGAVAANDVKKLIRSQPSIWPPLAAITVARRIKKSTKILIDTGRMLGALTWLVMPRGGGEQ